MSGLPLEISRYFGVFIRTSDLSYSKFQLFFASHGYTVMSIGPIRAYAESFAAIQSAINGRAL